MKNLAEVTQHPGLQALADAGIGGWVTGKRIVSVVDEPPRWAVDLAVAQASWSPCEKSKRGVVIYDPNGAEAAIGIGTNGWPMGRGGCGADEACRARCGELAVHAETRAIQRACHFVGVHNYQTSHEVPEGKWLPHFNLKFLHLVHVKVTNHDGRWELTVGKGPSCMACAAQIADVNLGAVWLYEDHPEGPRWVQYRGQEFYDVTIKNTAPGR